MYCSNCGAEMDPNAVVCVKCGFTHGTGKSFCSNCGTAIVEGQAMCTNCGSVLSTGASGGSIPVAPSAVVDDVIQKLNTSYILFLVAGICQIVLGFWAIYPIGFGIWNIVIAVNRKKAMEQFKQNPAGMSQTIKSWKTHMILSVVFNGLFTIIGIIGGIYDLTVISYVEKHEQELRAAGA